MNLSALRNAITTPRPQTPERDRGGEREIKPKPNALVKSHSAESKEGESECSPFEYGSGVEIESIRTRMLQTVHWSAAEKRDSSNEVSISTDMRKSPVMRMKNVPLSVDGRYGDGRYGYNRYEWWWWWWNCLHNGRCIPLVLINHIVCSCYTILSSIHFDPLSNIPKNKLYCNHSSTSIRLHNYS